MPGSILKSLSPLSALLLGAAVLFAPAVPAAELAQQSSQAGGVSISVKPTDVSPTAATWLFQVSMNTHTGDLGDDLSRTAALVDTAGKQYPAVAWEGDPAGGHHRKGVLQFKPLSPRPKALKLRIQRPGETAPRTFAWQLK